MPPIVLKDEGHRLFAFSMSGTFQKAFEHKQAIMKDAFCRGSRRHIKDDSIDYVTIKTTNPVDYNHKTK